MTVEADGLVRALDGFRPLSSEESDDVGRIRSLLRTGGDVWGRALPLHVTGSAVVVHPPSRRVLLRWHERQRGWLQVGGHADPGETDPLEIALREAREETGLRDLVAWPSSAVVQVAVVPVPPGKGEPAHEHADVRYALATAQPEAIVAESDAAPLAWLSVEEALERVGEDNLRVCLRRINEIFLG